MTQRARHPPSDSSDAERKAYQEMLVHRDIIRSIRNDLRAINLKNITNKEIEKYQNQVDEIIEYIINSTLEDSPNRPMIRRFVKTVKKFEGIGNLIINKFTIALSRWKDSHNPKLRIRQRSEAEEVYLELLNDCRTELGNLLAEFRDF